MTLHFELTEQANLDYNLHFLKNSPDHQRQRRNTLLAPIIFLLTIAITAYIISGFRIRPFTSFPIIAIVWTIYHLLTRDKNTRQNILNHLRNPGVQKIYGPYQLTLAEDGLHTTSPLGTSHLHWHSILSADLTPHYLIINLAGNQGYPIPTEVIGQETAQAAQQYIQQKITQPHS